MRIPRWTSQFGATLLLAIAASAMADTVTFESVNQAEGSAVASVPGFPELSVSGAHLVIPGNPRVAFNGNSTGSGAGGIDHASSGQSISFPGATLGTIEIRFGFAATGVSIEGLDFEVGTIVETVEIRVYDAVSGGNLLHTTTLDGNDPGAGDGVRTLIDLSTGYAGTDLVRRIEIENLEINPAAQIPGIAFDNLCYSESPVPARAISFGCAKSSF